jgi:penicillin-binding protein 1C
VLVIFAIFTPLPAELREANRFAPSVRVLDRNGALVREVRADDGCRARWVPLAELGDRAPRAMVAAEDRRFFSHPGIDPLAMFRALGQAIVHRRIVSGASTLTQQLARTVVRRPRNAWGKFREMALALRIEWSLSKHEILEQYMNRAPFGPGLRGIEAASQFYFDKPTRDLSLAEAALLAGMPRGPSLYDPRKGTARVERRRNRVLSRLLSNGQADRDEVRRAEHEPIAIAALSGGFGAPHFVRGLLSPNSRDLFGKLDPSGEASHAAVSKIVSTLDAGLEREAEVLTASAVRGLSQKHVTAASVVVLQNQTGDILAYVGSPSASDAEHLGENDGVLAKRQPGSALKPFVYELAMEKLGFTAATILPDVDLNLQHDGVDYHPQNYDGRYHGPVRLREALANSYNIPAVFTASLLGAGQVLERLQQIGFKSLDKDASFYGPAIALGDGEVRLLELANAYATLARGGVLLPVRGVKWVQRVGGDPGVVSKAAAEPVMRPGEVRVMSDILSDPHARLASFGSDGPLDLPFPVAVKTGTSKGFRDNWTIGYTREVTVAVWVGNFDGSPMHGVSGVTGAGPLFRDIMIAAHRRYALDLPSSGESDELVAVDVCPLSGALPSASCPHRHREVFLPTTVPRASCAMHKMVRVDVRNGLLAGARCAPKFVEERPYEAFESSLTLWAKAAARPLAPTQVSPLCPRQDGELLARMDESQVRRARLAFPFEGATFVYDDDASSRQTVPLRALAPQSATHVRFFIDGRLAESKAAPFLLDWPLSRGTHMVRVEADVGEPSDPVEFTVQ